MTGPTPSRALAQSLAQSLAEAGVTTIFGMPGGGANLDMIGAAAEAGITFVLAHTETAACIMAASHGLATQTPGVAIVTRGPGLTSAVNGMAQATLDRFPLLVISDCVPQASAEQSMHQRLDQVSTAAPVTKWSGTLGYDDPASVVDAAAALALASPAGAVHLAFDPTVAGDPAPPVPQRPVRADDQAWQQVRELVAAARRPVLILGLDAVPHADALRTALRDFAAPILTTYQAKGVVPESWPTFSGRFTGAQVERPLLEQADLVVGIGLDPVEPLPHGWHYSCPVVLLHSHDVESTYFGTPTLATGDYAARLPELLASCQPAWPADVGRVTRTRNLNGVEFVSDGLTPHEVVRTTRQVFPTARLTVDAGAHMLISMPLWHTDEVGSVLISNGLSTMGFSLPAAIGLALAHPEEQVVCFIGDGGLGIVMAELETLARLQLKVAVVVFNDARLSLIGLKQGEGQGGAGAVEYGPVDFAAVAAGLGIPAAVAETAIEVKEALSEHLGQGPQLVDARIDAAAYSHVIKFIRG